MRLALHAGCKLADMEMIQFHPTGMVHPESLAGTLVTEAVRGEGGHLVNADGRRFMEDYDSARMELSTRDRVALANYTEIQEGRGTSNNGVKPLSRCASPKLRRSMILKSIKLAPEEHCPTFANRKLKIE